MLYFSGFSSATCIPFSTDNNRKNVLEAWISSKKLSTVLQDHVVKVCSTVIYFNTVIKKTIVYVISFKRKTKRSIHLHLSFKHEKTDKLPHYLLNCEEREFHFGKNVFINVCKRTLERRNCSSK